MVSSERNQSSFATFILLGFSDYPDLQVPLFLVFLIMYSITVVGNLGMIGIIQINPKLHTPMYFFLSHLSFVDFCYSSIIAPKMLVDLLREDRSISLSECLVQFFFFGTFVVTESFLLAVMAYDRFMAICNPLLYTVSISQQLCALLVAGSYTWGTFSLLLNLSSSDTHFNQLLLFISSTFNGVSTLLVILASYAFIFVTVLKMNSSSGRHKAFSTCASHLMAITIFYGTILFLYCVPTFKNTQLTFKVASLFYTVIIPMLNPLIYSLRNKDVKETIIKLMNINFFSS
uniref:G-protein coupled receptors family 1 profile domain-containing protein n=1 Tax=Vombatus ursinus TaxID=29139 RepID=A0A4X2LUP0_VOMUR